VIPVVEWTAKHEEARGRTGKHRLYVSPLFSRDSSRYRALARVADR
jgi:hypothetical protein